MNPDDHRNFFLLLTTHWKQFWESVGSNVIALMIIAILGWIAHGQIHQDELLTQLDHRLVVIETKLKIHIGEPPNGD